MDKKTILILVISLVLVACLAFVFYNIFSTKTTTAVPVAVTSAPSKPKLTPRPTPTPTPEPEPEIEEPLPFAEAMGFLFEGPSDHYVPAVQTASLPGVLFDPVSAEVSAPFIGRSEVDEEGYVTYDIHYRTTSDASFSMPKDKTVDAFYVFAAGYDLVDYDTGRLLNSRDSGALEEQRTYDRVTELECGSVFVSEEASCTWGGWEFDLMDEDVHAFNRSFVDARLTVRVPADYHGLILALDVTNEQKIPAKLFTGGEAKEENPEFWEGVPEDWIFILVDEWVSEADPYEEAPEEEEEADEEEEEEDDYEEPGDEEEPEDEE